ncbi:MAG: helix-turn-helix domain-containing protein [Candidatus Thermoplasmatota archaeon]|nr:helix-turn-helix domain-containing protein [Candidatus Thermoplasmatota archaeon]
MVNARVSFRTLDGYRVVSVDSLVLHHYPVDDRLAEAYAMVTLVDVGYASQNDVARAFGYSARTLRRYQQRFGAGGLQALGRTPGRPAGSRTAGRKHRSRDQGILRLKNEGVTNRNIARQLGMDEKAIRKRLRQLGWQPPEEQLALFDGEPLVECPSERGPSRSHGSAVCGRIPTGAHVADNTRTNVTFDTDPLDRSFDRFLAALGHLEDACPLFAKSTDLPRAGVLIAVPALVTSGLLSIATKVYGNIGPAFYGLRTTLVAFVLFALLRINRPEALKEYPPGDLGRILGLDRAPEVKTLRRKLTRLAAMGRAAEFGQELARHRVDERGKMLGFLYVDGHVRVYHGKRTIPKAYVPQIRLALPATTDYWINDTRGDPLFVVTAEANNALTKMLPQVLKEIRDLVGPRRRPTIVFDRGGWSPKLFAEIIAANFHILTYRKGKFRRVARKRFILRKATLDGRPVEYELDDRPIRLLKGKLRLRQVTRLTDGGHQTAVIASRWDLRDIVVAYRMFERWRQENFFKYASEEFLIDALCDYQMDEADPTRSVPNPERRAAEKKLKAARAALTKLERAYGAAAIDSSEGQRPTMRGFKIAHGKLGKQIRVARARVQKLEEKRNALEKRVPIAQALKGQEVMKLATERKHLMNVLKMVAYQIESDLLNLIRPHYARAEDEGRTLVQSMLQRAATIDPDGIHLRVTLAPLSSAHRSTAAAALCDALNETETPFPGTELTLRYGVSGRECGGKADKS